MKKHRKIKFKIKYNNDIFKIDVEPTSNILFIENLPDKMN